MARDIRKGTLLFRQLERINPYVLCPGILRESRCQTMVGPIQTSSLAGQPGSLYQCRHSWKRKLSIIIFTYNYTP
ncbi:hypothetical protein G9C98_006642 [Cotesia typhae]|uniref:Uncharacterized protein n=1 Tax=Cotesia typhae TaxID=2053667 RepID=A0A8J5QPK7_9HYME|nr:hypothetical protein G9C98_006642 [Cotesia typhae]